MAKNVYDCFTDDEATLKEGHEVDVYIRSLAPGRYKYAGRYVRAIVSSQPEEHPEWDELWLRWSRGYLRPRPWAIKVLRELGEIKLVPWAGETGGFAGESYR
jgi:hypothetical protein